MGSYAFPRGTAFAERLIPNGECLEFAGSRDPKGYGSLRIDGRLVKAHRHAYELAHGPIPEGLHVKHSCDNPPCCNEDHLSAGTRNENIQEAYDRNLLTQAHKHCPRRRMEMVTASACGLTHAEIGSMFGIGASRVCRVISGRR